MLKRILCLAILALATSRGYAQDERQRALDLMHSHKPAEARPLLEKLVTANPEDVEVQTELGYALLMLSRNADPAGRKSMRLKARACLLRARQLGSQEPLVETVLASIPADGGEAATSFSPNPQVEQAMQAAESAFAAANFEAALSSYQKALDLDGRLYEAALYAGDSCLQLKRWPGADDYYAKAVAIDPDRETAYRYWGNALAAQGKTEAARSKYVEGIVCDPYNRLAWTGIRRLGNPGHPQFTDLDPKSVQGNQVSINVEKQDDSGMLAMVYAMTRGAYAAKERHTLAEEVKALEAVCDMAREKNLKDSPAWLPTLLALKQTGLLEAYVLLGRPDKGIAQDYEAYRKAHRPQLIRYLSEYYR